MKRRVSIKPACLRDTSFVLANMRAKDRAEVFCQLPDGVTCPQLAMHLLRGKGFVAYLDDQPVMVFGTSLLNVCTASVWALGTPKTWRVVPAVSQFIMLEHVPDLLDQGITSVEARSILGHDQAHKWMLGLGAERSGEPFVYGKGGELFQLFRWTVEGYRTIREGQEKRT